MTIIYCLILVISIFAALYSGYYFGYTKSNGAPPEHVPVVSEFQHIIEDLKDMQETKHKNKKGEDDEPKSFFS